MWAVVTNMLAFPTGHTAAFCCDWSHLYDENEKGKYQLKKTYLKKMSLNTGKVML